LGIHHPFSVVDVDQLVPIGIFEKIIHLPLLGGADAHHHIAVDQEHPACAEVIFPGNSYLGSFEVGLIQSMCGISSPAIGSWFPDGFDFIGVVDVVEGGVNS